MLLHQEGQEHQYYRPLLTYFMLHVPALTLQVWCTKKDKNISITVLPTVGNKPFVVQRLIAKNPAAGYTAPCQAGLLFVMPVQHVR